MNIDIDCVPNTAEEAVAALVKAASSEDLEGVRAESASWAQVHFGFGMFIRNAWSLWEDTPIRRDCISRWKIAHADDVSSLLLAWFIAEVRGDAFDPEKYCERFHEHWESYGTTALKAAGIDDENQ